MLQFRLRRGQFDRQLAQHLGVRMQGVTCLAPPVIRHRWPALFREALLSLSTSSRQQ